MMNRSVIGLVVLLWMTTIVVPRALAQGRIPSADEFSNGPKSHNESELTSPTPVGVPQMRVDWDVTQDGRGHSMIEGYVYNLDGVPVNSVRLRVDSLDAAGQPLSSELRLINGLVPSEGRTYFEFPAPSAANYQVSVDSVETVEGTQ
jgi:hypothetical protein